MAGKTARIGQRRQHVDGEEVLRVLTAGFLDGAGQAIARIVDQHVDPACRLHGAGDGGLIPQVDQHGAGAAGGQRFKRDGRWRRPRGAVTVSPRAITALASDSPRPPEIPVIIQCAIILAPFPGFRGRRVGHLGSVRPQTWRRAALGPDRTMTIK
jgi:hypothetical protein